MERKPLVLFWPKLVGGRVWIGKPDTSFDKPLGDGWGNGFDNPFVTGDGISKGEDDEW